jgi:excisionase family DNA binding protein
MKELFGIKYYEVNEAAVFLHYSDETIRRMCRDRRLDAKKIGKEWLIPEESLKKLFGQQ